MPDAKRSPTTSTEFEFIPGPVNVVVIGIGKKATGYQVFERNVQRGYDTGRGFTLIKLFGGTDAEATGYDVFVTIDPARVRDDCTCKGFITRGQCKHHDVIAECLRRGLFDPDRRKDGRSNDRNVAGLCSCPSEAEEAQRIPGR